MDTRRSLLGKVVKRVPQALIGGGLAVVALNEMTHDASACDWTTLYGYCHGTSGQGGYMCWTQVNSCTGTKRVVCNTAQGCFV